MTSNQLVRNMYFMLCTFLLKKSLMYIINLPDFIFLTDRRWVKRISTWKMRDNAL